MEKDNGNNRTIPILATYRCVWSAGGLKHWETTLMCGGVYEDELKDEADAGIAQPITKAPESPSKPEEDDGYYYPGSDPQE
ncbi:hypothetical protein OA099_04985 [Litorivicinus sp.]|nr:hypothetical protein [Litorivicinus sp.]